MIDTHRLRVWRAVVASGSVQAAARHLGYTPSTVSQHLQQLQRETKLVLTEKAGRGLRPTPAGLALAAEAEQLEVEVHRLEAIVADLREGRTQELAIRCAASVAHGWIPPLAARLRRELPGVVLEVSIGEPHEGPGRRTPDLIIRSRAVQPGAPGQSDAGSAARPRGYVEQVLATEDFVVVVPRDWPLSEQKSVRMAELAQVPWIDNVVYEQGPTLGILLTACQAAGFTPRWAARCHDHIAATGLVGAGVGVTALPVLAARMPWPGTVILPLTDPTPQRGLVAWQRASTAHTQACRVALATLRELAGTQESSARSAGEGAVAEGSARELAQRGPREVSAQTQT
ncbi:DNA-binding transcriptional LysR family regulator [Kineosphaera limosa]|uniref:Putative LysR family transcriptional regulator n=1 Tax=Kineosphaera limosa NBRC 100340 TaxID=1184609 RepID=K6WV39_9MICO|nr:LysR family transcriptional regulator [Kineosphaera limosa]NYE01568.1 DNA-binding transcriptional LysR family regulator [Kineosphaera limosa]GAB97711.1 putative LysR family transcriptional regulator [Kineosphaera limosa NBRC 100340]